MFWWFERRGEFLRYEARDLPAGGFELRVINPDGTEHVENFSDSGDLARRQVTFEHDLATEGWTGPHGWNL